MTTARERGLALLGCSVMATGLLVRMAWLPGVPLTGLGHALLQAPPADSLPLLLALAGLAVSLWLSLTVAIACAVRLPGAAGHLAAGALRYVAPAFVRRAVEVAIGATTVLAVTTGAAQAAGPLRPPPASTQLAVVGQPAWHARALTGLDQPATITHDAPALNLDQPATITHDAPALNLDQPATITHDAPALNLDRPATVTRSAPALNLDRPAAAPSPTFSLDRPATTRDPARGIGLVTTAPTRSVASQAKSAPVTVRAGDSLWRIAARSLPEGAGERAVERAWHQWYDANRSVIGDDPNLLQPGQLLTPPQA